MQQIHNIQIFPQIKTPINLEFCLNSKGYPIIITKNQAIKAARGSNISLECKFATQNYGNRSLWKSLVGKSYFKIVF